MNEHAYDRPEDFKSLILDNLWSISKNAAQLFDNLYRSNTQSFSEDLGHCFHLLQTGLNTKEVLDDPGRWEAAAVLWQGANSLIGAYQSLREGFASESALIIRYTLELQALAIAISEGSTSLDKYLQGKLRGNRCITLAKKVFPAIGKHYNILSSLIHPTKDNVLNYLHRNEEGEIILLIGAGLPDRSLRAVRNVVIRLVLELIEYHTSTFRATIELILFDQCEEHHYWEKTGGKYKWKPSAESEERWVKRTEAIEQVIRELPAAASKPPQS